MLWLPPHCAPQCPSQALTSPEQFQKRNEKEESKLAFGIAAKLRHVHMEEEGK